MKTYAVIDIGTLKVKTEVASINEDGTLNRIYNSNNLTCFGVGLDENNGNVQEEYLDRTIAELQRVKKVLGEYDVAQFKIVSTHAMRRAVNREYVLEKMQKETQLQIENISQEQEAELFFKAVMRTFQDETKEYAVVDVGGGSVQVLIGNKSKLKKSHMMQTGAQYLHEVFTQNPHSKDAFTTEDDIEKMRQRIIDELVSFEPEKNIPLIYGSSMIIDVMKHLNLPLDVHSESTAHPYKTYATHLNAFLHEILPLSMEQRETTYKIPQYGFIWGIDKGFINVLTISNYLQSPYIIPSNANIAQGIIYSLAEM